MSSNKDVLSLSPKLREIAKRELNEDAQRIPEDLATIKEWLQKTPYINARTDDQWLLMFLRSCKFSIERTKEKLNGYYTAKTFIPEVFQNRDPFDPIMQDILTKGGHLPLKNPENEAEPALMLQKLDFDLNKYDLTDLVKAHVMVTDILIPRNKQFSVNGVIGLVDFDGPTLDYLTIPISTYRKLINILINYPVRIKSIRIFNVPPILEKLLNTVISFMGEKISSRVSILKRENIDKAFEGIPKKSIPFEYGGEGGTIAEIAGNIKKVVEDHVKWFKEDENYRTDEALRPGKPITQTDLFGIDGSFRKLEVD